MDSKVCDSLGPEFPIQELVSRFDQKWTEHRDSNSGPVTRVASFNLIIVSQGNEDDKELMTLIEGLENSHPSRVIWTKILEKRAWKDAGAQVRLGCHYHSHQICSEQIQIVGGHQPERLSSMILPMIRAGLPTYLLWWNAGPTNDILFERLSDRAHQVYLEDSDWPALFTEIPRLWHNPRSQEITFLLMSWLRLTRTRQAIASAYSQGESTLILSSKPQDRAFASLLKIWLRTLLPAGENKDTFQRIRVLWDDNLDGPGQLDWQSKRSALQWQSPLEALRAVLSHPREDHVFTKMVANWYD